jgi:hypothetical protein
LRAAAQTVWIGHRAWRRLWPGFVGAALGSSASAQTHEEFWPELNIWWPLTEATRVLFDPSGTRDRETGDKGNLDIGVYLDYRYSERVSWRAGYVYTTGRPVTPADDRSVEHRLVTDFNYRWRFGEAAELMDRTRLDIRNISGDASYRVRNRLRLEYTAHIKTWSVTPYASVEVFYDERFDALSRYRFEAGANLPITHSVEVEIYFGRQRDSHPSLQFTNGIGITLSLTL